ncbi:MAG: hypothetical protein J6S85_21450 [Methanobrevibacter sp.]|nr:hypothetical protein [Methanobrevibacter sp.]
MKTSTITLYYKSLLNKEKNFILDNSSSGVSAVENYLSTLEKQVITEFQYVKHQVVLSIKIDKSQDALNMGLDSQDLNYIKIQNDGEPSPKYYFIVGKTWKAESTIELTLNMDTLNSFQFNKDYEINKRTLVKREHKDRFSSIGYAEKIFDFDLEANQYASPTYSTQLVAVSQFRDYTIEVLSGTTISIPSSYPRLEENTIDGIHVFRFNCSTQHDAGHVQLKFRFRCWAIQRQIDLKSEEINAPVYKYREETLFEKQGQSKMNWALYYRNRTEDENAPVDCFLVADQGTEIEYQTSDGKVNSSNVPSNGDYIIFYSQDRNGYSINVNGSGYAINKTSGWSWGDYVGYNLIAVRKVGDNVEVYQSAMIYNYRWILGIRYPEFSGSWTKIFTGAYIQVNTLESNMITSRVSSLPNSQTWMTSAMAGNPVGDDFVIDFGETAVTTTLSKTNIDRTLSTNIKIIDVPYCPTNYELINDKYVFPSPWKLDLSANMLKLNDLNEKFDNEIISQAIDPTINLIVPVNYTDITTKKRFLEDSKLYHSDYFRDKFVYDSFSKIIALEKIDYSPIEKTTYYFKFKFNMTRNIVSKFLFTLEYNWKVSVDDYDNVVAVSRNNEEVLYTSAYLNYIRTGYNYDLKAKERQDTSSAVGIGLSALGMVASIALAVATENPLPIAGAVAGAIGLVGQTANYAKQTAQNEENIQRKLQETQMQAVSVMNADDIDLLVEYSGNKAKIAHYKVSTQMHDVLDDLFYYGGYIVNEQKIPDINSRYWFNYVQASLIIEESNNLTEEIENDIKQKFETGVTFLHNRQNRFDFKQEMENIEKKLVGG